MRQLTEGELHRFRKIIDVSASKPEISVGEGLRAALKVTPRGAMAIEANAKMSDLARLFSSMTGDGQPVDVFRSIHEARKWGL